MLYQSTIVWIEWPEVYATPRIVLRLNKNMYSGSRISFTWSRACPRPLLSLHWKKLFSPRMSSSFRQDRLLHPQRNLFMSIFMSLSQPSSEHIISVLNTPMFRRYSTALFSVAQTVLMNCLNFIAVIRRQRRRHVERRAPTLFSTHAPNTISWRLLRHSKLIDSVLSGVWGADSNVTD